MRLYSQNILISDREILKLPKLLSFLEKENFNIKVTHDINKIIKWVTENPFGFIFTTKEFYKKIPQNLNTNIVLLLKEKEKQVNTDLRIILNLKKDNHVYENIFAFILRRDERNKVTDEVLQTIDDSEIRFKQLFENAPIPIWEENFTKVLEFLQNLKEKGVTDFNEYIDKHPNIIDRLLGLVTITDANVAVMSYFNALTKADFSEKMRPIYLDKRSENFRNFIVNIFNGSKTYAKNSFIEIENSEKKFVHLTWSLVNEYDDEYARVFISLVDLTERKAFEDALKSSEMNLKHLYHNSPVMMFSLTENGILTSLNERWLKTIGLFRDEVINLPFLNFVAEEDQDKIAQLISKDIWQRHVIEGIEFKMVGENQMIIHCTMDSVVSTDPNGHKIILNVAQDITEKVRLEHINTENERLRNAVNQFANILIGKTSIDEILWDISENCIHLLNFEDCVIYLYDKNQKKLTQFAGFENKADLKNRVISKPISLSLGEGITGTAAKLKKSVIVNDLSLEPKYIIDDKKRESEIAVPILYEGELLGVIDSEHSEKHFFTNTHVSALESIANLASVKIMKHKAESETRIQQQNFYSMINDTNENIALFNTRYEFIEMNDAIRYNFRSIFGIEFNKSDNFIKKLSKMNQDKAETWKERFDWALNGESYFVEEKFKVNNKDVFFEIAFNPVYDKGQITGVVFVGRNITERKITEQRVRQNEALLNLFFTQSIDGFFFAMLDDVKIRIKNNDQIEFIVDMFLNDLKFTKINQAMLNQYSANIEDIMGKQISVIFNSDENVARKFLITLLKKKHHHIITKTSKINSSQEVWIEGDYICMFNEENEFTGFFGVQKDITEKIESENERKQLEEQIQHTQKLESLGVLAGGIAHDFNNILTSIMGSASFADEHLSNTKIVGEMLKDIHNGSERAAELCRQMLAYSGKGKFVIQKALLPDVIKNMTSLLEISISKKVTVVTDFAEDTKPIEGDLTQIRQIIMNLITNASEAIGDKSGKIYIRTGNCFVSKTELLEMFLGENLSAGNFVYFEVQDTGSGIDDQTKAKIFDPFFTTKFTGRGLGMSAVLGIVKSHMGAIKVDSIVGKGTTFKIFLPILDDDNTKIEKEIEIESEYKDWLTSGKVLIADDEEPILKIARRMLEKVGYDVTTAINGKDALKEYKADPNFDLLILDLTMPEMNGIDLYKKIREDRKDLPIILSSGYNEQTVYNFLTKDEHLFFIQKPFNLKRLVTLLKTFA